MRLAFRLLNNVNSVNSYVAVSEYTLQSGNPSSLYFQLVDVDQPAFSDTGLAGAPYYGGLPNSGNFLRFMPLAGATITAQFTSIDLNRNLSKIAVQPFAQDPSIWMVQILSSDLISTNGLTLTLIMGGQTYTLQGVSQLVSSPANGGQYFC